MFKPSPLAGHQSLICKRMIWQRPVVYSKSHRRLIGRWADREQRKEDGVSLRLSSLCPQWPPERKVSPVSTAPYSMQVGGSSRPPLRQTEIASQGKRGQPVRHAMCVKVSYQEQHLAITFNVKVDRSNRGTKGV